MKTLQEMTMSEIRRYIYIKTSSRKPEQMELVFVQPLGLGGYREEGRKMFAPDAHLLTDFIQANRNEKACILKSSFGVEDGTFKDTFTIWVITENCDYKLF